MAKKEFDFDAALSDIFAEQPEIPDAVKVKDIKEVSSEPEIDPIVEAKKKAEEEAKRKGEAERKRKQAEEKAERERKEAEEKAEREREAAESKKREDAEKRKKKKEEAEKRKKEVAEQAERERIEAERKRRMAEKALKKRMTIIYVVCTLVGLLSCVGVLIFAYDGWVSILLSLFCLILCFFGSFSVINGSFPSGEDDKDPKWKTIVYRSVFALLFVFLVIVSFTNEGELSVIGKIILSLFVSFGGTGLIAVLLNLKRRL